ncbi:MAG TPA: crosslink repair DNA glycosylase YcaQ family protein [Bryobacteraceae bacterium]|nr:crosslink repair DNA glycosylase YcaQ family protein [Bryobacteraceae bacterium]
MRLTLKQLRRHAITASLFRPTSLRRAIERLGFVQADPIRSPARAQDLILRHRVKDYRAGDLERQYPSLNVEEDVLYAYGFMPQSTWQLLHPRLERKLSSSERRVLEIVSAHKRIHPRELEAYLDRKRELNAWGGYSKATTRTLQALHYRGLLRIAGRENGVRLYEPTTRQHEPMEPGERLRKLVLLIAAILAPLPDRSLRAALQHLARATPGLAGRQSAVTRLIESGDLVSGVIDDVRYVWPAGHVVRQTPEDNVRFLAPFDPLVWDRRRFEHLWGWSYRFEAYTPAPKRKLGYYAMPLLWQDDVVGWVNVSNRQAKLSVQPGFSKGEIKEPSFQREFEAEVERFRLFLNREV